MKIREWLSSLDDLYRVYAGTTCEHQISEDHFSKDLDYQLFAVANMQDDAEKQLKESVTSFLNHEYDGRVNRLLLSDVYTQPRYTKMMYAFYKYMNSLGKYRIYLFSDVPEITIDSTKSFTDVYLYFRESAMEWKRILLPQPYNYRTGYPIGERLKEEFDHWKIYIRTEMCNDGFDADVIWKKMVDLLCTLAVMDTMLRDS